MSVSDRIVTTYTWLVLKTRWLVLILSIASALAAGYGAQYLTFSNNYRYFFGADNPQLQAFNELQNVYSKRDNLLVVIKPKSGRVFEPKLLQRIKELTEAAWKLPYVIRVDSITNFQHTTAQGDDLIVADLIGDPAKLTPEELDRAKSVALNEPLILRRLISPDASTTGVNMTMLMPDDDPKNPEARLAAAKTMAAVGAVVDKFRADMPDATVALSGSVALSNAFSDAVAQDLSTLVPLMYVVVALLTWLLLRSVSAMIAVILVIGLSTISAMGLAGWIGFTLTPPSSLAPIIILTLAVADSVHILNSVFSYLRRGYSREQAIIESMRVNFLAVFLTSFTTAIGFLSLNTSDAPPFRDLGNIVTLGVITAWIYSITFIPAFLSVIPLKASGHADTEQAPGMAILANVVIKLRWFWLVAMTALTVYLGMQIPKIELNDQFVHWFDKSTEFRRNADFMIENLTGIMTIEFSVKSGEENGVTSPEFLKKLEGFQVWAMAQKHVVHVQSITDVMKRLNKSMNGDDPAFYRLPDNRQLAAQYLLLYELSLPLGLDLNDQINVDKSSARIVVTMGDVTSNYTRWFKTEGDKWVRTNIPSSSATEGASPGVMFSYIAQRNIESNILSIFIAFTLISLSLIIPFRSLKHGLVSIVPNAVPAILTFGIWYFLQGRVGMASAVVTSSSLGIIVDSTIHILSKYLRARREEGASPEDAVRYAFSTVGPALWVLTLMLVIGFGILALSPFEVNKALGQMTALAIACALIADFFLLPPLLIAIDRMSSRKTAQPITAPAE
ncbi:MAG: MMPL family transporter [Alphaproteobacteria bacterium]|nr:MMPL family transporter [Alphaproteobacteria bacterium]